MKRPIVEWYLYSGMDQSDPLNCTFLLALKVTVLGMSWGWMWTLDREQMLAAEVLYPLLRRGKVKLIRVRSALPFASLPRSHVSRIEKTCPSSKADPADPAARSPRKR